MVLNELSRCVAAGCLVLTKSESRLSDEIWSLLKPGEWHHIIPFSDYSQDAQVRVDDGNQDLHWNPFDASHRLSPAMWNSMVSPSGPLAPFSDLMSKRWLHMSLGLSLNDYDLVIGRVYILPDDVDNRTVPRTNPSLRKARLRLLSLLDFSPTTWQGQTGAARSSSPEPIDRPEVEKESQFDESQSLLQMFNTIPSPDPSPHDIDDLDARDAAYRLLSSNVVGLKTSLYAYQRRSAALMVQRESQTQQVLDPRLVRVADQLRAPWYYDAVSGAVLREPRYYDTPRGGILAEEMGAGKTLICLSLILATRHIPSSAPDHLRTREAVIRPRVGSLADMAAACITRNSVPWKTVFGGLGPEDVEFPRCVDAIRRNAAPYRLPRPARRRQTRQPAMLPPPAEIQLSHVSLVIVPANLVQQWKQEIAKHTTGLRVLIIDRKRELPAAEEIMEYDIVLFSSTRFERLWEDYGFDPNGAQVLRNPLATIHFKRCIVDEGHRLGNSTTQRKSNMHLIIDQLQVSAKWIVTGTPSKGLFGVDDTPSPSPDGAQPQSSRRQGETSAELEREDLRRIGSIATLYLHMRPWANQWTEPGDTTADWAVYVMQPRHPSRSTGSKDCLKRTLESLIIRHRLSEVGDLFPMVSEKIVYLDGSFQDRLVLNLFSMMIIFNAVQSQRTDQDYFFHPRQRKALLELVSNLRQASFFGGSFFSAAEIRKAVDTAENFLREGKVPISAEDERLLREAIAFGRLAENNSIKRCANVFREVPLYVERFPWDAGREWSLDLRDGDPVCTDSRMISALQKFLHPLLDAPASLQLMFDSGRFTERGREERGKGIEDQDPEGDAGKNKAQPKTLAGNTQLGQDHSSPGKRRSSILTKGSLEVRETPTAAEASEGDVAAPLAGAQLISTASAKLSYLIDQIVEYQASEQIIVFYENDNVAYYLAGVLEILQIQHLIYAKALTTQRRAQYVTTFNRNPKFRVLLMDLSQAAFGLDMHSASRVYFVHPVLNPQVEAQAVARARRISQTRPVTVETLVLRGSVEEVIVRRRGEMTQAEQRRCRSILDDRPIYEWILEARILPLDGIAGASASDTTGTGVEGGDEDGTARGRREDGGEEVPPGPEQMAKLRTPQFIFGRGSGRGLSHPDQDLVAMHNGSSPEGKKAGGGAVTMVERGRKRRSPGTGTGSRPGSAAVTPRVGTPVADGSPAPKKRVRVRFADDGEDGG